MDCSTVVRSIVSDGPGLSRIRPCLTSKKFRIQLIMLGSHVVHVFVDMKVFWSPATYYASILTPVRPRDPSPLHSTGNL